LPPAEIGEVTFAEYLILPHGQEEKIVKNG
jgi:hypothetical protein